MIGLGGPLNGIPREDGFMITVASEVMAILCLAKDLKDLKERLGNILFGYTYGNEPLYVKDINAQGAMAALLKDAIMPNLVQTLEHTPVFMHGGPFANIAHGCNSVRATELALKLSDITVTEAGFGADLGAEKFMNIKCRQAGIAPDAVVIVTTIRALKHNGGVQKEDLQKENLVALEEGAMNLEKHIENVKKFKVPIVVTLNAFVSDTEKEIALVKAICEKNNVPFALANVWANGGEGGVELAKKVVEVLEKEESSFEYLYEDELSPVEKIHKIAKEIYGAEHVVIEAKAQRELARIEALGLSHLPICMAKNQYSFSDNPKALGRPTGFTTTVKEIRIAAGAGFIVALTGSVMTMPGLGKNPAAEGIDVDEDGRISGLF
jgi:formate--tetrahydrofolate ligase